jgi:hypothetical protein
MQGMGGGRPRIPDEEKLANGTYRRNDSGNPNERLRPEGDPEPGDLSGEELEIWNELAPGLIATGCVKKIHSIELQMMCEWLALYRKAQRKIDSLKDPATKTYLAALRAANIAFKAYRQLACRFPMNPSDQGGIRVSQPQRRTASRKRG